MVNCAVAGALVTVAVSWGLMAFGRPFGRKAFHRTEMQAWPCRVPADWPKFPTEDRTRTVNTGHEVVQAHAVYVAPARVYFSLTMHSTGFPAPALTMIEFTENGRLDSTGREELSGTIELPSFVPTLPGMSRRYPVRPVWPGFVIDTAFYGGIFFLCWSVRGELRRRVRGWRGRCQACGYDMRGSRGRVCPECGAQPQVRVAEA